MSGIERLQKAGRRTIVYGCLLALVLWIALRILISAASGGNLGLVELAILCALPVMLGVTLLFAAWILKGSRIEASIDGSPDRANRR